ncbi:hypothetical protein MPTK1_5g04850 [Marchantia polymorpha subsp. ruderalis]|uniref:Uncharacterized protein n=2 Tax=Marchantia polymorpha TaxID=3197 RepID=A0AAF6BF08_MARPO|nr:hypothetical protein MARPO_0027s0142 [Marchantia polymorpha]BBN10592.1 hypothetical protein Mp_5g04850 [Marchantia polymorpha subsp. ruderalis]|eukprot:PTQ43043.1 hypothetical protein MARPO_0027s0142 [Marchantia polymorpha]
MRLRWLLVMAMPLPLPPSRKPVDSSQSSGVRQSVNSRNNPCNFLLRSATCTVVIARILGSLASPRFRKGNSSCRVKSWALTTRELGARCSSGG